MHTQAMSNYDMSVFPGRTYKYYVGTPLFAFGHGLSYTTFSLSCAFSSLSSGLNVLCNVTNTGPRDGDEVVQVYHKIGDDVRKKLSHPAPLKALVEFERVSVGVGATVQVPFVMGFDKLSVIDENGEAQMYTGSHMLVIGTGAGQEVTLVVVVEGSVVRSVVGVPVSGGPAVRNALTPEM